MTDERKNWKKSSPVCWQTGLKPCLDPETHCISDANESLRPSTEPRDHLVRSSNPPQTGKCSSVGWTELLHSEIQGNAAIPVYIS